jgi:hexosaminidase
MAYYKLNRFHWHLTEDQGWRIEIKKYPKLTEIGAWRDQTTGDGKRYGGFYTQDQIREIVAYAADRFITVIPEIEMPGHSSAALAAYPELACFPDRKYAVQTKWGVFDDVLCPSKPATWQYVQDVLDEVMTLFPGGTIHIGGDECPRTRWKQCPDCQALMNREHLANEDAIQNYFTRRVMGYLHDHCKRLQGWNEIMHGGALPSDVIVQAWNDETATARAAKAGNDVVVSFHDWTYLNFGPENIPMSKVYALEPTPSDIAQPDAAKHILGVQAQLWTEYRPTDESCDEYIWPRLCALAAIAWSPKESRNYDDFLRRLKSSQYKRLAMMGLGVPATQPTDALEQVLSKRGDITAAPKKK